MLLVVSVFLLLMLFVHVIIDRSRLGLHMVAVYASLIIYILSYILVWCKYGGMRPSVQYVLCFTKELADYFTYLPFSADLLSVMMNAGRTGFIFSILSISLSFAQMESGKEMKLGLALLSAAVLNFVLFLPAGFAFLYSSDWFYFNQGVFFIIFRILYAGMVSFSIFMLFRGRQSVRISLVKRQFSQIILLLSSLSFLFTVLMLIGPMQVSYANGIYYSGSKLFFSDNVIIWAVLLIACMSFMIIGSRALWRYSKLQARLAEPGFSIDRKIRQSGMSVFMITHGLKNHLLVLLSMLSDFQEERSLDREEEQKIARMLSISQNMMDRINQLYTVFRSKTMALIEIENPHVLVDDAVAKSGHSGNTRLTVLEEFPVLADREYLTEAFNCIIRNAWEAMESDGVLRISIYAERGKMVFQFSDSGKGIRKRDMKRVFDPFFTSKNSNANWGIGLSFVQQVVKSHYGNISVDSEPGKGTDFFIMLPISRGKP